MDYRAFVAFSGGGAKGLVHVGALKALEDRNVRLTGVSGTSAGSIVAALAAAGFKADDMINAATGDTLLQELGKIDSNLTRATDLFGGAWWRIHLFRLALTQPFPIPLMLILLWATPPLFGLFLWEFFSTVALAIGLMAWFFFGLFLWLAYRSTIGGLASVRQVRNALAELLRLKLFPDQAEKVVCMEDFGRDGRPALKIVSANLSRGKLHLFSSARTPKIAVADAVAASICLPVIFVPWLIDGELHCDGGIVSNLPAWPFDEERELDPEALTVAVEIESDPINRRITRFSWLPAAIKTGLFGSGELNIRVSGHTEQLLLKTNLRLLDFDKTAAEVAAEVRIVADEARLRLDERLFRLPEIYRNACRVAQALALDGLSIGPGGRKDGPRVRVAVGRLERGYVNSLRLSYSVGFEDDTDEFMLVPLDGSVAGIAWRERQSTFETYPLTSDRDLPGDSNRLRRKARWQGLTWTMCIPILDEGGMPRLLVVIDSNTTLADSEETTEALESVEEAIKEFFGLVFDELKELEDGYGA